MIHRIVYNTYPIDPISGAVSELHSNFMLEAYTDAEVDEIQQRLEQFHELEANQHVKVKIFTKEIIHASLVLTKDMPPLAEPDGYISEFPDESHSDAISRERGTKTESGLIDPSSF